MTVLQTFMSRTNWDLVRLSPNVLLIKLFKLEPTT